MAILADFILFSAKKRLWVYDKMYFICWNKPLSSGWQFIAEWGFVVVLGLIWVILAQVCKLIQGLFFSNDMSSSWWGIVV